MLFLGQTLVHETRYSEAEKLQRKALDVQRRALGPEHPATLYSMSSLGVTLTQERRYAEAEKQFRETLEIQRRVLGPEHQYTLGSLELEAIVIAREGRYTDAEKLFREAIAIAGRAKQSGLLGRAWDNFACAAANAGRREEALNYLEQAIDNGFRAPDAIAADPDLKSLHGDPRFEALVAKARQSATGKAH